MELFFANNQQKFKLYGNNLKETYEIFSKVQKEGGILACGNQKTPEVKAFISQDLFPLECLYKTSSYFPQKGLLKFDSIELTQDLTPGVDIGYIQSFPCKVQNPISMGRVCTFSRNKLTYELKAFPFTSHDEIIINGTCSEDFKALIKIRTSDDLRRFLKKNLLRYAKFECEGLTNWEACFVAEGNFLPTHRHELNLQHVFLLTSGIGYWLIVPKPQKLFSAMKKEKLKFGYSRIDEYFLAKHDIESQVLYQLPGDTYIFHPHSIAFFFSITDCLALRRYIFHLPYLPWCQSLYFSRPIAPLFHALYTYALAHPTTKDTITPFIENALVNDINNLKTRLIKCELVANEHYVPYSNFNYYFARKFNKQDSRVSVAVKKTKRYYKCTRYSCENEIITVYGFCSNCSSFKAVCLTCIARYCQSKHSNQVTFHMIQPPAKILYLFLNNLEFVDTPSLTKCQKKSYHYLSTFRTVRPASCCKTALSDIFKFLYHQPDVSSDFLNRMGIRSPYLTFDKFITKIYFYNILFTRFKFQALKFAPIFNQYVLKKKKIEITPVQPLKETITCQLFRIFPFDSELVQTFLYPSEEEKSLINDILNPQHSFALNKPRIYLRKKLFRRRLNKKLTS